MSTVYRRRGLRRRHLAEYDELPVSRRRAPWNLGLLLVGGAVLVGLAPTIVAHSPALSWVVSSATRDLNGSLRVGGASLGWFSNTVLTDVELRDRAGNTLLKLPRVEGNKSALALVTDRQRLGTWRLERPEMGLLLAEGTSNWEAALAKWMEGESTGTAVNVEIVEGRAQVRDEDTGEEWLMDKVSGSLQLPELQTQPALFKAAGQVTSSVRQSSRPRHVSEWTPPASAADSAVEIQQASYYEPPGAWREDARERTSSSVMDALEGAVRGAPAKVQRKSRTRAPEPKASSTEEPRFDPYRRGGEPVRTAAAPLRQVPQADARPGETEPAYRHEHPLMPPTDEGFSDKTSATRESGERRARIRRQDEEGDAEAEAPRGRAPAAVDELRPIPQRGTATRARARSAHRAESGQFDITLEIARGETAGPPVRAGKIRTEAFPLALVESLARRVVPEVELDGALDADVNVRADEGGRGGPVHAMEGRVGAQELVVSGPWLQGDVLTLARLEMPCDLTWNDREIAVDELSATCDVGQLRYQGTLPADAASWSDLTQLPGELRGKLDLAQLAAKLPRTVHVREGTQITDGDVELELVSQAQGEQMLWHGRVETSNLVAVSNGRPLTWEKPILVTFEGRDNEAGAQIDHLYCQSKFLELEAAGTREYLSASASFNLERLNDELGRFLDLGELRLAGDGWSHMTWKQQPDGRFTVDGETQVRGWQLLRPDAHPWQEENLLVFLEMSGRVDDGSIRRVDTAQVTVEGGQERRQAERDQLVIKLEETLRDLSAETIWPVSLQMHGELARWLPRLEPWLPVAVSGDLAGRCTMRARGQFGRDLVAIEQSRLDVEQVHYHAPGLWLDEPQVVLEGAVHWSRKDQSCRATQVALTSQALVLEAQDILIKLPSDAPRRITGTVTYRGDLGRLIRWTQDPALPGDWQAAGRLAGQARILQDGELTTANLDLHVDDLLMSGGTGQPWREAQVRLVSRAAYDSQADRLDLATLELKSNAVRLRASGDVADLDGRRQCDLAGRLEYDAAQLTTLIQRYAGADVVIQGRGAEDFTLRGPLRDAVVAPRDPRAWHTQQVSLAAASDLQYAFSRELTGEGAFGWDQADLWGFRVGKGALRGRMREGSLAFDPLETTLSGGRLRMTPLVRMNPGPAEFVLAKGRVVEGAVITPAMCDHWLKYIAPVVADVTQASGKFSIDVDSCRVPLGTPSSGDIAGRLLVERVEIGPGPLMQELAVLLNRTGTARLVQSSQVPFRMVNGRIYHRDLQLVFPEFTIRTHGSVGLDESLALLAEMPVPPKWIGKNPLGEALKQQTIRLPIGGTLSKPRIDRQELDRVMAETLRNTAGRAIMEGVNRSLDKQLERLVPKLLNP